MRARPIKLEYDGQDAAACSTSTPQAHYVEDYATSRICWWECSGGIRWTTLPPSLPASLKGPLRFAGRNTTRPGGMAVPLTRAGLHELPDCQLVCVKLYFCPHNPAQGAGKSG